MHLELKHVLTAPLECINVSFFVQNAFLKGSYSHANIDLDPLFVSVNVISLLFDRFSWNLLQIMHKWLFLTMISTIYAHM